MGEMHSPLAGDPALQRGSDQSWGTGGCKRSQDPKAVAALTADPSLASLCRSGLGE